MNTCWCYYRSEGIRGAGLLHTATHIHSLPSFLICCYSLSLPICSSTHPLRPAALLYWPLLHIISGKLTPLSSMSVTFFHHHVIFHCKKWIATTNQGRIEIWVNTFRHFELNFSLKMSNCFVQLITIPSMHCCVNNNILIYFLNSTCWELINP